MARIIAYLYARSLDGLHALCIAHCTADEPDKVTQWTYTDRSGKTEVPVFAVAKAKAFVASIAGTGTESVELLIDPAALPGMKVMDVRYVSGETAVSIRMVESAADVAPEYRKCCEDAVRNVEDALAAVPDRKRARPVMARP